MPRGGMTESGAHVRLEMAGALALDEAALCVAIEMADGAMRTGSLPRHRYASLVAMLYAGVCQRMSYAHLLDFARSWAAEEVAAEAAAAPPDELRAAS